MEPSNGSSETIDGPYRQMGHGRWIRSWAVAMVEVLLRREAKVDTPRGTPEGVAIVAQ